MLRLAALIGFVSTACFHSDVVVCADGTVCPASQVCEAFPEGTICVDPNPWKPTVVVGSGASALDTGLAFPIAGAVDRQDNLFIVELDGHVVRRVDPSGAITIVAGTGTLGSVGDGGFATSAELGFPSGVVLDSTGNLLISDAASHRVRKVDAVTGTITTIVGTGVLGNEGVGSVATLAELNKPRSIAIDTFDNLFIVDEIDQPLAEPPPPARTRILRVDATTKILTVIFSIGVPTAIAVGRDGRIYYTDPVGAALRITGSTIDVIAGLTSPLGIAVDNNDNVFVVDNAAHRVHRIDGMTGAIDVFAGTGASGFSGDGGDPTAATLGLPIGITISGSDVYIFDTFNARARRVRDNVIETVAGNGLQGSRGEGGLATSGDLSRPEGVVIGSAGNVFISDTSNHRVRRVDAAGLISTIAGTGSIDVSLQNDGDDGPATLATIQPVGIAIDAADNLYVTDTFHHTIRRVDPVTGTITTVAGVTIVPPGFDGDGPATTKQLHTPTAVAVDQLGNLFIADTGNDRIRRVDAVTGFMSTIVGTGNPIDLHEPQGVAVDAAGNLFISDSLNHRVLRWNASNGNVTVVAGTGAPGVGADGAATSSALNVPRGLAVDAIGNLFIADSHNHRVRRLTGTTITTIVNVSSMFGVDGDLGPATDALLAAPNGLVHRGGELLIADAGNARLRRIDATSTITTLAGDLAPDGMGPLARGQLADPRAIAVTPRFTLIAGGNSGTVQAIRPDEELIEVVAGRYPRSTAFDTLARYRAGDFTPVRGIAFDPASSKIYLAADGGLHVIDVVDPADEDTWTIASLSTANAAGIYLDATTGELYATDTSTHTVIAIDVASGSARIIAGTLNNRGFGGDNGPATDSLLFEPEAVTRCPNGDVFIADTGNHRIRRVDGAGVITTVLGVGVASSFGIGAPSRGLPVNTPRGLACDSRGNVFVTSTTSVRLLAPNTSGVVDGGGQVTSIYGAPSAPFPATVTRCLTGITVIDDATVQLVDACVGWLLELRLTE